MTRTTTSIRGRYVCSEHTDHLVTWRGHGCTACTDRIAEHREARVARRATRAWQRAWDYAHQDDE